MPKIRKPGKFESELEICVALYQLSLDGGADDEVGDANFGSGWYGLMAGVKLKELLDAAKETSISVKGIREDFEEVSGTNKAVNAVLHETSDGFVACNYFDTEKAAKREFDYFAKEIEEAEEGTDFEGRRGDRCSSLNGRRHC